MSPLELLSDELGTIAGEGTLTHAVLVIMIVKHVLQARCLSHTSRAGGEIASENVFAVGMYP